MRMYRYRQPWVDDQDSWQRAQCLRVRIGILLLLVHEPRVFSRARRRAPKFFLIQGETATVLLFSMRQPVRCYPEALEQVGQDFLKTKTLESVEVVAIQ